MEPEARHVDFLARTGERLANRIVAHQLAVTSDEYAIGTGPLGRLRPGGKGAHEAEPRKSATGRFLARPEPTPVMLHGFTLIAPSRRAQSITVRRTRYDRWIEVR